MCVPSYEALMTKYRILADLEKNIPQKIKKSSHTSCCKGSQLEMSKGLKLLPIPNQFIHQYSHLIKEDTLMTMFKLLGTPI